jgi:diguanylate cyclase (GGDEF)-like protein
VACQAALGLVYAAATLIVLVSVLETVFKHAYRDGLSDLPARRRLDDTRRSLSRRYAIAMLDVDHFKRFSDRYGHATGDEVLKMIAARAGRIRGGRSFRYGGEEFVVVFTRRAAERAEAAMEAFRRDLARTPFVIRKPPRPARTRKRPSARTRTMGNRQKARVTVSIGLAAADRRRKAANVLKAADKALYKAKRSGRNRLCREAGARRTTAGPAVKFERKPKR